MKTYLVELHENCWAPGAWRAIKTVQARNKQAAQKQFAYLEKDQHNNYTGRIRATLVNPQPKPA